MKIFNAILLSVLFLCNLAAKAQQIYQTREGSIGVIGVYRDAKIIANSNQLVALINYETAEIELTLNPVTLHTATDSLNLKLLHSSIGPVLLKGKLNIPYIKTLSHPDYKLNFEAELQLNGIVKSMYVTGVLKHIYSNGIISCLLTLSLEVGLSDFGIKLPEGWSNEIAVQIIQTVLKKPNQQESIK